MQKPTQDASSELAERLARLQQLQDEMTTAIAEADERRRAKLEAAETIGPTPEPPTTSIKPEPGDTLVIIKDGGRCDVKVWTADGGWAFFRDSDLPDADTAYGVAAGKDGVKTVWWKLETECDSAIQPYKIVSPP